MKKQILVLVLVTLSTFCERYERLVIDKKIFEKGYFREKPQMFTVDTKNGERITFMAPNAKLLSFRDVLRIHLTKYLLKQ